MKMENFLVNELTITDEWLCASLSNTPAVLATAGWADGSISKSVWMRQNENKKKKKPKYTNLVGKLYVLDCNVYFMLNLV